ncbi:lipase family alpha/beta hydrolase [Acinetobacter sp. MD2(2019)]|uniref:lipase family alpha/beta hydrolase n=1 Tax=Acinetobacter sp. MD2(2019) TaxID=2605273 RepID=UPI002D1E5F3E|nr:alpha/beta fold hydrolase [Acinetobacter sp. MD2(2019)]MEB3752868.1 alpha/beta fold hydrolase [Acinetobacter sp. MD2(2019)]
MFTRTPFLRNAVLLCVVSPVILTGCQVVNVKQQALNITIANERDSILTRDKLSEASLNLLSMTGRESKACMDDPNACLADIQNVPQVPEEQVFAAASELYLAKAGTLEKSSECKSESKALATTHDISRASCLQQEINMLDKSVRYGYAYLFKSNRAPQQRIFNNRQVQVRDFYNLAVAKLVTAYRNVKPQDNQSLEQFKINQSTYHIDFSNFPELKNQQIEDYMSSYNLNFSGLRSINRRDGFGSEFVTILKNPPSPEENKYILDPLHYKFKNGVNPNIHRPRYLATTITIEPFENSTVSELLNHAPMVIKIHDPYKFESITVDHKNFPLAANFSAPYGLWLAQNNLGKSAYLSLIDRDQKILMPHLYMLEPYNPNKKVIILVHGLASSPEAWIRLTNDIMGDNVLREHYQVWQVFYSTNMPIIESRFQIYALLQQTFAQVDPKVPAYSNAVLIGHSMGGIISRLLVSNDDIRQAAFKLVKSPKLQKHKNDTVVTERLVFTQIPNFDRAVFLSSPHKGTPFADLWFTKIARRVIRLPVAFVGAVTDTIQGDTNLKDAMKQLDTSLVQNGPSDLSYKSKFMQLTRNVNPPSSLVFHSVMGNITKSNDPKIMTDGVVPYESAHLPGAVSEKIIPGGHSIQETPEAVLELRRILRLHLIQHGLYKPSTPSQ